MYIRKTVKTHKGKTYTNHLPVESVHTPKRPRQRIICSLGSLSPGSRAQWLTLGRKLEVAPCRGNCRSRPPSRRWPARSSRCTLPVRPHA